MPQSPPTTWAAVFWAVVERHGYRLVFGAAVAVMIPYLVVWGVVHFAAEPGTKVEVLGFAYVKRSSGSRARREEAEEDPQMQRLATELGAAASRLPSDTTTTLSDAAYSSLFTQGSPFPQGYDIVRPGMPLSFAKQTYPNGYMSGSTGYVVQMKNSPFSHVVYNFRDTMADPDPPIWYAEFATRSTQVMARVREQLIRALGTEGMKTTAGGRIGWDDVDGRAVVVDQSARLLICGKPGAAGCP
jgi:hypothetical protein